MFAEKLNRGFSTGFSTFIIRCFLGFFNRAIVSLFYRLKIICFFVKFPLGTIVTVFLVTYKWQVLWSSPFTDMTKVLKEWEFIKQTLRFLFFLSLCNTYILN